MPGFSVNFYFYTEFLKNEGLPEHYKLLYNIRVFAILHESLLQGIFQCGSRLMRTQWKLTRIGIWSAIKIVSAISCVLGFVVGFIWAFVLVFFSSLFSMITSSKAPGFGVPALIIFPILFAVIYAVLGALGSFLITLLFNLVAGIIGGLELEIESQSQYEQYKIEKKPDLNEMWNI